MIRNYAKLLVFIMSFCGLLEGATPSAPPCNTPAKCSDLNNACQCYCSRKCGPRNKTPEDKPVWVENDPYGNFCYCKQWDLDNFKVRCLEKESKAEQEIGKKPDLMDKDLE